jgi:[ribosomal protein S18]-alanine N-acetyltransferase
MTVGEIRLRHTGRLDAAALEQLVAAEGAIHNDCGWRRWELPLFAEYGRNIVFEVDGELAGSAQLVRNWDQPSVAYLAGFGLLPERQKQGLGARCLGLLIEQLKEQSVTAIELTAAPDNAAAVKIYSDAGFRVTAKHDEKYGPGEDRLIMRLNLEEPTS